MSFEEAVPTGGLVALERATLRDVDFRKVRFERFALSGCVFVNCDFRGIRFDRKFQPLFASPRQSVFRQCRFDGSDLRKMQPSQARFEACTFDDAVIEKWSSTLAEFVDCRFSGPIVSSRFYGRPWGTEAGKVDPPRRVNEFRGNDFSGAELQETIFLMGIDIDAQRWPDDKDYVRLDRMNMRLTKARDEILRWKDLRARNAAHEMVQTMSVTYLQQSSVIARRVEPLSAIPADVQREVWALLARVL
ncbi:MAG: pentapeptide repeat-containing protein [Candidatus Limnocylindria bacterium]